MTFKEKVNSVLVDQLGVEESSLTADAHLVNNLGADQSKIDKMVKAFQDKFDIEIPDEDAQKFMTTVDSTIEYLREKRVKRIIVDQLNVEDKAVNEDAHFIEHLGADSLDTVELIMAFEEEFDIQIPDEAAEKITTVGAAIKYLKEMTA